MLEIRRGSAVRSYENTFFREFAKNLQRMFERYSIDGLLIANSECEAEPKLQIDALLLTNNAICLIDFKNFGGEIILPQAGNDFSEGRWVNQNNELIKGGSSINPYKQLYIQKGRFSWVFHTFIKENISRKCKANPRHTKKIVCFQKPVELNGDVPARDEIDFFITDSNRYLETIKDIIDVHDDDINLSKSSFDAFKNIFRADSFNVDETYKEPVAIETVSLEQDYEELYPDQASALQEIKEFISSDSENVFILQGTSLSGKSHLLPFIEDIGYNNNFKQVEYFASSSRVASNLLSESSKEFNSIYSYIYGGGLQEAPKNSEDKEVEVDSPEDMKLEVVPLKRSDNEDKALFIVDEAQLVSDSYHQSIDLRFGSGKLLEDFINFTDIDNSNRKIIFVGDSYQLNIGKKEQSALNPAYLENKFNLKSKAFQLIDKEDSSTIVKQALTTVNGIRDGLFNQLSFCFSDDFTAITKADILPTLENRISNNSEFHLLSYTNSDAQKINYWIKRSIIRNGNDLAEKDLIIFNNNIKVEDVNNPFAEPNKVFNGQFGTVTSVENTAISEVATPKGKQPITLKFREVNLALNNTGHNIGVLSLENYRINEKGELSEDEIIALKIILNREITDELSNSPFEKSEVYANLIQTEEYRSLLQETKTLEQRLGNGEKVKTKLEEAKRRLRKLTSVAKRKHRKLVEMSLIRDTSSKYFRYKNVALLRFGWALTVHKSMSYKWSEIFFNIDQGENRGKTNEGYFQWVYTGITRAKEKVNLINYRPITPLSNIVFKDGNTEHQPTKNIYFAASKESKTWDLDSSDIHKYGFTEDKPVSILLQLYRFLNSKLESKGIDIIAINHPNYQEMYELENSDGATATVSIYYNLKGHFKPPQLMKSAPSEFGEQVIKMLLSSADIHDLSFIDDRWRQEIYTELMRSLQDEGYQINHIIQTPYRDEIKISRGDSELVTEMRFNGDGFFTTVRCTYYSDSDIWKVYMAMLENLKN